MKVIDLLIKIANGEEVPKRIKYNDVIYWYDETDDNEIARYVDIHNEWLFGDAYLNDEIEIIEDIPKEKISVSEEQILFNNLTTIDQEYVIRIMKMLQQPVDYSKSE